MKELPILFSTEMVKAILEGRKSQTRRIVKPQPDFEPVGWKSTHTYERESKRQPGDILYVRETWCYDLEDENGFLYRASHPEAQDPHDGGSPWKPSIHMPKEASRIWLKVTDIRVERLQDISEEDAKAEGAERMVCQYIEKDGSVSEQGYTSWVEGFNKIWRNINGAESWKENPWVWVISFEVISTTGKPKL